MTAPNGPILFNSSTGNDSTASGLGPSVGVIGSSAELDGTSTVDVSFDGVSLSSISAGDLLYCSTSSGRQFSIIASVDTVNETITTDDAWPTESGVSWAVGGKRATFDNTSSRRLFIEDGIEGFILETETDQLVTSRIYRGNSRPFILVRGSGTSLKTLTASGDFILLDQGQSSYMTLYNLKFVGSANNTTFATGGGLLRVRSCRFGDNGQNTNYRRAIVASNYASRVSVEQCVLYGQGASVAGGYGLHSVYYGSQSVNSTECFIKDFEYGVLMAQSSVQLTNTIITNVTVGLKGDVHPVYADRCIFNQISTDAIQHNSSPVAYPKYWPIKPAQEYRWGRNIFSNVTGDVFNGDMASIPSTETEYGFDEHFTCYLYNSSGFTGITFPSVTLTVDPFVDAANDDFNLNATNGGGGTLRSTKHTLGG